MPDKKQILNSIASIASQLGRPPSRVEFISRSGISLHFVLQFFPRWSSAIKAAGLRPYTLNVRIEDGALLEDWGKIARRNKTRLKYRGRLPRHIYRRQGKFSPHTLANRFGGWSSVPQAFRRFAKDKREWADVLALVPAPAARAFATKAARSHMYEDSLPATPPRPYQHPLLKNRTSYGNPTNFRGLRYEPMNEQGVVLLFGMLAKELGYLIEAVRKGFPDCEALRQVAPQRWQRVTIEFEFESRNFRDHGHPATGCDVIVCWRHNWEDCPRHIEVLELSRLVKSLTDSSSP
jgi:Homing endonuclease associated repeat